MSTTRRNFLKYCGVGTIALSGSSLASTHSTPRKTPTEELSEDLIAAIKVWRETQQCSAGEFLFNKSKAQIKLDIQADFTRGETLNVNGWVLSKSEVAVAVVFAENIQQSTIDS